MSLHRFTGHGLESTGDQDLAAVVNFAEHVSLCGLSLCAFLSAGLSCLCVFISISLSLCMGTGQRLESAGGEEDLAAVVNLAAAADSRS